MSIYQQLKANAPKVTVKKDAREVIFTVISVMCDNRSQIVFKKKDGEFTVYAHNNHCALALSNYQMEADVSDLTWAADDGDWATVIKIINSGTTLVQSAKSR